MKIRSHSESHLVELDDGSRWQIFPGDLDITPWADRVQLIDAKYDGVWELPALGTVAAPTAVLIRPDGYVAWVGDRTQPGLADALTTWFGPPTAA